MPKFDLQKTQQVLDLFAVARDSRDDAWRMQFYEAVVDASMSAPKDQVLVGPDGFPYFVLNPPPVKQEFEPFCISHILQTCLDEGLGVVLQPDPAPPQWVLPYGMLWCFNAYGKFEVESEAGEPEETADIAESGSTGQRLLSQPSESFFPPYARKVIKKFLEERTGRTDIKMMLVTDPTADYPQSLAFDLFPEDFADPQQFSDIMGRITWFLPGHYGLVSMEKDSEMAKGFEPL
jgi:hypothetical protein